MPVRVTIHSSEVSTIFSRSRLVRILSGRDEPVPAITALRIVSPWGRLSLRPSGVPPDRPPPPGKRPASADQARLRLRQGADLLLRPFVHPALDELPCDADSVLNRLGRGAAMADDHALSRSEQRRAAVLCVVHPLLQSLESRLHQQGAQPSAQRTGHLL